MTHLYFKNYISLFVFSHTPSAHSSKLTHLTKDRPKSFKKSRRSSTKRSISASTKSSDDGGSISPISLDGYDDDNQKTFLSAAAASTTPPSSQKQRYKQSSGGARNDVTDENSAPSIGNLRQHFSDSKTSSAAVTSSATPKDPFIEGEKQSDFKPLFTDKDNDSLIEMSPRVAASPHDKDVETGESKYSYDAAKKKEASNQSIVTEVNEQPEQSAASSSSTSSSKFNKGGFGRGSFRLPGLDELRGRKSLRKTNSNTSSKNNNGSSSNKEGSTPLLEETMSAESNSPLATSTLTRNKNKKNQAENSSSATPESKTTTKGGFFSNNRRGGSIRLNKSETTATSSSANNGSEQHKPVKRSFSTGGSRSDVRSLRERLESGGNSLRSGISRLGSSVTSRAQPRMMKKSSVGESEKLISEDPDENTDFLVKVKDDKKVKEKEEQQQKQQLPPKEKRRIIGGQSAARITSLKAQPSQPSYKKLDRGDSSDGPSQPSSPTKKSPLSTTEPLTEFYKPRSVSPKLQQKRTDSIEDDALNITTSKREWSLEERISWERQQLEESKKQYEQSKSSSNNYSENTNSLKPYQSQQQGSVSHREVIQRNKENSTVQQLGSQYAESNNIMTGNENDEKNKKILSMSSSKNIMKDNNNKTHVVNNPQPSPQISNNDKPFIVNNKEAILNQTTEQQNRSAISPNTKYGTNDSKYGVSNSIYGNSRKEQLSPAKSLSPHADKFSSNKQYQQQQGDKQTFSGWTNQKNIFDGVNKDTTTSSSSSFDAVPARKSFSIKALTPKLGRRNTTGSGGVAQNRKIDENGRILDKKGCAQRNIVSSLPFPSSPSSKDNDPNKREEPHQQQQQLGSQGQQGVEEDKMQTDMYEKNFKKSNASRNSTSSWLGKSGLFDIDSTTATGSASGGDIVTPSSTNSKNTFKTRDDSTTSQSICNNDNQSSNNGNSSKENSKNSAAIKQSGERQHLLQDDFEDESDEDACLDRSILINDKKNKKIKDDRDKSDSGAKNKTNKLAGGLSFRKKYNFDKL